MIARRHVIGAFAALGGAACWPLAASTQQSAARIGWLSVVPNPQIEAFRAGMQALGYVEGRNLTIEQRDAAGHPARLGELASELLRLAPDVVVAVGVVAATAARNAIRGVPIVFVTNDSVDAGFADSLARPGGNMTGVELMSFDIHGKGLELVAELLPRATRFTMLVPPLARDVQTRTLLAAAATAGKQMHVSHVQHMDDLARVFDAVSRTEVQGMVVLASAIFHGHRREIVEHAARLRLPAIYEHRDFPEAGGLMSYGPDIDAMFRRLANYVFRILRGFKPADMPIEQPTKFELVINLRTAAALDLTVPESLLARADEVIE